MKFLGRLITCNNKNSNDKWVKDRKFNYHYVNHNEVFSGETIGDIIFHMYYLNKKYSNFNLQI